MSGLRRTTTYVLPLRVDRPLVDPDFVGYLRRLGELLEVIVVDGSPAEVFAAHDRAWGSRVRHLRVRSRTLNGKVAGVVDGVAAASTPYVVIADDDVRYDEAALARVTALLGEHDAVMPQNHFRPLPWHARWDTARSLLNRAFGHDYAGTVGVRRDAVLATSGYCGAVLFENLELLRTLTAAGFQCRYAPDVFVVRRPPTVRQFLSQRVRQAYDSRAQPVRWAAELAVLPAVVTLALVWPPGILVAALGAVLLAEVGRRRYGGKQVFGWQASRWAPLWVAERGVCSWLALAAAARGGVSYRGGRLRTAAHRQRTLATCGCPEPSCSCDTLLRPARVEATLLKAAGAVYAVPRRRGSVDVTTCPDGPLLVRGASAVVDAEGTAHPTARPVVAVCRCDKSGRRPWCDGTHKSLPANKRFIA